MPFLGQNKATSKQLELGLHPNPLVLLPLFLQLDTDHIQAVSSWALAPLALGPVLHARQQLPPDGWRVPATVTPGSRKIFIQQVSQEG